MNMMLSEMQGEVVKITLHGRLDTAGVDTIETRFAVSAARRSALVDLSDVSFLASMGIRMLISAARALKLSGHNLVLIAPNANVGKVLDDAGLDQIIPIASDEQAALQMLLR